MPCVMYQVIYGNVDEYRASSSDVEANEMFGLNQVMTVVDGRTKKKLNA